MCAPSLAKGFSPRDSGRSRGSDKSLGELNLEGTTATKVSRSVRQAIRRHVPRNVGRFSSVTTSILISASFLKLFLSFLQLYPPPE